MDNAIFQACKSKLRIKKDKKVFKTQGFDKENLRLLDIPNNKE